MGCQGVLRGGVISWNFFKKLPIFRFEKLSSLDFLTTFIIIEAVSVFSEK